MRRTMKVILYGAHGCPMCAALGTMLKKQHIEFEKNEDIEYIKSIGLNSIPVIEFESGERMDYSEALAYIKSLHNNRTIGA